MFFPSKGGLYASRLLSFYEMTLSVSFGRAPSIVIEKFNEFKSIYSSVTAALDALLERENLLTKKYLFFRDVKFEEWEAHGMPADSESALVEVTAKLDSYVQYSRLDSRAAAVEELLMFPSIPRRLVSDGETPLDAGDDMIVDEDGVEGNLDHEEQDDSLGEKSIETRSDKRKRRKNRKPKKHKRKYMSDQEDSGDEGKKKPHPKDVWRRVGSKFIGWYTCILCAKKLKSADDYTRHMEMHGDAHSPACMDCGNYFESMIAFEHHIGNLTKDLIYKCDEESCGKAFQFKCRLECHKRTHAGELMYNCNDCGHKLSSIRSIIRHTRAKHLNEKPFKCHMCDKAFAIQSQLTRHIKDHISPPHYSCEDCGRTFLSRQGYHYHQLDHMGVKPHKCSCCGKAFRNKTDMINHERIHSGDRPFTCELCGKSFVEKGALRKHRVVHTREKNFVCSNCGKQFGYKCSLDGHLKKCQQELQNTAVLSRPPPTPHPLQTPQHEKPLEIVEDLSTQSELAAAQDNSHDRNMYSCPLPEYSPHHESMPKNRNAMPQNNDDLLANATAVLKSQQEAAGRLMKKNPPYRQMGNLMPNVSKQSFTDKHIMQDAQMYPGYAMQLPHQRDTIDSDILASMLGQKLPIQAQMEAMQYNDRLPRDEAHSAHYRALTQQDRDPSHIMDGLQSAAVVTAGYNPHRHPHSQHPPSSISESMMFQQQIRGHYRP